MTGMNDTQTLNTRMPGLKDIQLQSNPIYPGHIFFLESPK